MKIIGVVAIIAVSLLAGFAAGFRTGGLATAHSEHTYQGVLATYYLGSLEKAETAHLKASFEADIANAKFAHEQLKSPLYTYGAKLAGLPLATDDPKYINRIMAHLPKSSE